MAQGKHLSVLFASQGVIAKMPQETVTKFVAQLDALGIAVITVDTNVDTGAQVENAQHTHSRIVGYLGHSEADIPGFVAATKRGGLAIAVGGPASVWCAREEGRSVPFGKCLEVSQPSNAIQAIQAAIGGF